jgi:hypothetical protein
LDSPVVSWWRPVWCCVTFVTGLTLSFVLAREFTPSLLDMIKRNYKHVETLIADQLAQEVCVE